MDSFICSLNRYAMWVSHKDTVWRMTRSRFPGSLHAMKAQTELYNQTDKSTRKKSKTGGVVELFRLGLPVQTEW